MNPPHKVPPRLQAGDRLCVVSPSRSLSMTSADLIDRATSRVQRMGFDVDLAPQAMASGPFSSASVELRVADLHRAFSDPNVRGVLSAIGGYNCNQLLGSVDFELLAQYPKVFCGRSDITVLLNAIYAKTGIITYHGPHFSNFGIPEEPTYTIASFLEATTTHAPYRLAPPPRWTDDRWWADCGRHGYRDNRGPVLIQPGQCEGTIVGGNLSSLVLLAGTPFWPRAERVVLFLEELGYNPSTLAQEFDRHLQCVLHQMKDGQIVGLVLGKFITAGNMDERNLREVITSKRELRGIPVVADLDFGHTEPRFTFPIGGTARLSASANANANATRLDLVVQH